MKFVDDFREPAHVRSLLEKIHTLLDRHHTNDMRPIQIMEFCGGHTHTIFRHGLDQLLPDSLELVHGPGCPVCVLPMGCIDDCVALAEQDNVIFATFGDAMRVPGSRKSLLQAKADGADIRMVYSPLDALKLARDNPNKEVIFFSLGFETTMPATALTLLQAKATGIRNFTLFCNHITTIPTIKAILDSPDMGIDGFIAPGHVSMVIGEAPFRFISEQYHKPMVITGFEPVDILQSIYLLLKQITEQRSEVENQYQRVVKCAGNQPGMKAMAEVFEARPSTRWRGLGAIDQSGVRIREPYSDFDAEQRFTLQQQQIADPDERRCGEVLKGKIRPWECPLFGTRCKPESPLGALMVSSEGACAAYHNYGLKAPRSKLPATDAASEHLAGKPVTQEAVQ